MSNLTRSLMLGGGGSSSGSTYLGPMTWAELQASAYANGSPLLAAMSADAQVLITGWANPTVMMPSADRTYWQPQNGLLTLAKAGLSTLNSITGCAAAITWTLAADPANGKTRITSSAAHGITSAVNGKCISITAWSGTGAAGLYEITYVDTTNIDLTIVYNAGYGNPTVSPVNTETTLVTVAVPAKLMQANSQIRLSTVWRLTSSANNHYLIVRMGANGYLFITPSNVTGFHDIGRVISNVNSKSLQFGPKSDLAPSGGGNLSTSTINTDLTFDLAFRARTDVVAEFAELLHYTVEICV